MPEQPAQPAAQTAATGSLVSHEQASADLGAPASPAPPQAAEKQPPWGDKPEDFDADRAWKWIQTLEADKARKGASNESLNQRLSEMEKASKAQAAAIAAAFGIKPEETSDSDKLSERVTAMQKQVLESELRAVAAEFKIPQEYQHMLTATDPDGLREQAAALVKFAEAAHYAATTATPPEALPSFQINPGQGRGGGPTVQDDSYPAHWLPPKQQQTQ